MGFPQAEQAGDNWTVGSEHYNEQNSTNRVGQYRAAGDHIGSPLRGASDPGVGQPSKGLGTNLSLAAGTATLVSIKRLLRGIPAGYRLKPTMTVNVYSTVFSRVEQEGFYARFVRVRITLPAKIFGGLPRNLGALPVGDTLGRYDFGLTTTHKQRSAAQGAAKGGHMAGGNFQSENKVRPGVYVNFTTAPSTRAALSQRGTVVLPLELGWGPSMELITLAAGENPFPKLGYEMSAPEMLAVREAFQGTNRTNPPQKALVVRVGNGSCASRELGDLTVTARYSGARGNDIGVGISQDANGGFMIETLLGDKPVDEQRGVEDIGQLRDNAWVAFTGTGSLASCEVTRLQGGTSTLASEQDYLDFLTMMETVAFDAMAYCGDSNAVKAHFAAFAKRMRNQEGRYFQCVMADYPNADMPGVVSVCNGYILPDGTEAGANTAAAWYAGASAGAEVNQSLTFAAHPSATGVLLPMSSLETEEAILRGEVALVCRKAGVVQVEQDINTLTTLTSVMGTAFRKNRVLRTLDCLAKDTQDTFTQRFLGNANNDANGRNLLKGEIVALVNELVRIGAATNFDPQGDITVEKGATGDAVVISIAVQPVDAVEKIYMTITVG